MPGRRKTSAKKKKNGDQRSKKVNVPDLDTVLSEADKALETSDLETAKKCYNYASGVLRTDMEKATSPASMKEKATILSKVLGKLGEIDVSFGDQEGGRNNFLEAIDILNSTRCDESMDIADTNQSNISNAQFYEARAILHLYLGQLNTAEEALDSYKRGICDLEKCIQILEQKDRQMDEQIGNLTAMRGENEEINTPGQMLKDTRQQLCGVHCSVAEIYLTDLCFEPDAETLCENALKAAISLDTPEFPPDAVQTLANLRLSQNRGSDAVSFILDSYNRMKLGCEALADLVGLGKDNEMKEVEQAKELDENSLKAVNSLPGFEFRCQTAKILLECASFLKNSVDNNEVISSCHDKYIFCVEASIQVLGSLLAGNDEVIEIWFLLGCAFSQSSPPNTEAAIYYWKTALDMLQKVKSELEECDEMEDEGLTDQLDDINTQIQDIDTKLKSISETE